MFIKSWNEEYCQQLKKLLYHYSACGGILLIWKLLAVYIDLKVLHMLKLNIKVYHIKDYGCLANYSNSGLSKVY